MPARLCTITGHRPVFAACALAWLTARAQGPPRPACRTDSAICRASTHTLPDRPPRTLNRRWLALFSCHVALPLCLALFRIASPRSQNTTPQALPWASALLADRAAPRLTVPNPNLLGRLSAYPHVP